jgi:hypothetical protein
MGLMLFLRGRAFIGEVATTISDTPGCVSALLLRVAEALAALALR